MSRTPYQASRTLFGLESKEPSRHRFPQLAKEFKKRFLVFLDGFESGNLSSWSKSRP